MQTETGHPYFETREAAKKMGETPEESKIHEKVATAFLRQRYQLTEQGASLRAELDTAVQTHDAAKLDTLLQQLPTVENPHLELFKDLAVTKEQEDEFFGRDIATVQVTKGCRHKCDFCAAGAATKVETMPFSAVLKIAEKKKKWEDEVTNAWKEWVSLFELKTGFPPVNNSEELEGLDRETRIKRGQAYMSAEKFYKGTTLHRLLKSKNDDHHFSEEDDEQPPYNFASINGGHENQVTNYYDSDPFDYRDPTFPHSDGTPADYGDVFLALASSMRPVHITTAGWPAADKVALRAAQKIVNACRTNPNLQISFRISVNRYEMNARKDAASYLENIKNVITAVKDLHPQVMLFGAYEVEKNYPTATEEDRIFYQEVILPLETFLKGLPLLRPSKPITSLFSGPMSDNTKKDDHHDVMSCMSGVHIWPNGAVALQRNPEEIVTGYDESGDANSWTYQVPKGARPTPTGIKIF